MAASIVWRHSTGRQSLLTKLCRTSVVWRRSTGTWSFLTMLCSTSIVWRLSTGNLRCLAKQYWQPELSGNTVQRTSVVWRHNTESLLSGDTVLAAGVILWRCTPEAASAVLLFVCRLHACRHDNIKDKWVLYVLLYTTSVYMDSSTRFLSPTLQSVQQPIWTILMSS